MANLFFANDLGNGIIYNASGQLAYHKIGTSATPANAVVADVDTANINAYSFSAADINGLKDYSICEHAISCYLDANVFTLTTVANVWATLVAASPSAGALRIWGSGYLGNGRTSLRVGGIVVIPTPNYTNIAGKSKAVAINVAAGDLVEIKTTVINSISAGLLPQSY